MLTDDLGAVRDIPVDFQASDDGGRHYRKVGSTLMTDSSGTVSMDLSAPRPNTTWFRWYTHDSVRYAPMSSSWQAVTVR